MSAFREAAGPLDQNWMDLVDWVDEVDAVIGGRMMVSRFVGFVRLRILERDMKTLRQLVYPERGCVVLPVRQNSKHSNLITTIRSFMWVDEKDRFGNEVGYNGPVYRAHQIGELDWIEGRGLVDFAGGLVNVQWLVGQGYNPVVVCPHGEGERCLCGALPMKLSDAINEQNRLKGSKVRLDIRILDYHLEDDYYDRVEAYGGKPYLEDIGGGTDRTDRTDRTNKRCGGSGGKDDGAGCLAEQLELF